MIVRSMRLAALSAFVLLSACAQSPHRAFDVAGRDSVRATEVIAIVPQTELNAQIEVQNSSAATAQFGLIGALVGAAIDAGVNASRASNAEEAVRPLRDKLLGFDFDAALTTELDRELATLAWLKATPVRVSKQAEATAQSLAARDTSASGVLLVRTAYELTPNFAALTVKAFTSLEPVAPVAPAPKKKSKKKQSQGGDADTALYKNVISVGVTLDSPSKDKAQNAQRWSQDDLLKRALQAQAVELARLVALDLQASATDTPAQGAGVASRAKDGTLSSHIALASLPPVPAPGVVATSAEATAPVAEGVTGTPEAAPAAPADASAPATEVAPAAAPSAVPTETSGAGGAPTP